MPTQKIHDRISISTSDRGVADVRLDRADKMNALDPAMFSGLVEASDLLARLPCTCGREAVQRRAILLGDGCAVRPDDVNEDGVVGGRRR